MRLKIEAAIGALGAQKDRRLKELEIEDAGDRRFVEVDLYRQEN